MKNLKFITLLIASVFVLGFQSCKNPCKDVTCVNGTCDEDTGECLCTSGYEGADCGTAVNAKFLGNFTLVENCLTGGPYTSALEFSLVSGETNKITIKGLWQEPQFTANASIGEDGTSILIQRQPVTTLLNREISGSGSISADATEITLSYSAYKTDSTNPLQTCNGTATRN